VDWNTKYLNAPGTALHDTEIWVSVTAVAVTVSGARLTAPLITSANGCAELGTLNARTVIVYTPGAGAPSSTCSMVLLRAALPPVVDCQAGSRVPRNVPEGPVTSRSRSFSRFTAAAGVEGKSVHASVARSGSPASTWTVNVRVWPALPCGKPGSS